MELSVYYNRFFVKGWEIFGGLVFYGVVWRIGVNEVIIIIINKDFSIGGGKFLVGKYILWIILGE